MNAEKCMTQTAKAWMEVANMGSGAVGFRVRASLEDSACVEPINGFTFALFMDETGKQLPLFCDPSAIFSYDSAFLRPNGFYEKNLSELRRAHQVKQNIFPCCFAGASYSLQAGESVSVYSVFGHAEYKERLTAFLKTDFSVAWFQDKSQMAEAIARELCQPAHCHTANARFDEYCRRTYLDNFLRGGRPVYMDGHVLHLYSRKHGDLERDYNYFSLTPEPYSQGNGNFRDIWQNRRCDVSFAPFVGEENVTAFYSLIQPDGYNPLIIKPDRFVSGTHTMTQG